MASGMGVNWCVALKEHADVNRCTVRYYEMSESGPPHNPTFSVKVEILCDDTLKAMGTGKVKILCDDTLKAMGTGKTKKAAKAQAAQALMVLIEQGDKSSQSDIPTSKSQTQNADVFDGENFIGELQELCQKNRWPLPSYTEQKILQSCLFVSKCTVNASLQKYTAEVNIGVKGYGASKRIARSTAAENALHLALYLAKLCAED